MIIVYAKSIVPEKNIDKYLNAYKLKNNSSVKRRTN